MKVLEFLVTLAALTAIGAALGGWLLMLTVGVIHGEWLPEMPTIGFWSAVKVSAMLSLMLGVMVGAAQADN